MAFATALRAIRWLAATLALAIGAFATWVWLQPPQPLLVWSGTADIAARYDLIDHNGALTTQHRFLGQPVIYTFGWARDPDLTPAVLQVLSAALALPPRSPVQGVFITLDPERDDPAALAALLERSGAGLVGLTGAPGNVAALARAMRLAYRRTNDPAAPGGLRIDHSILLYLFDGKGGFVDLIAYDTDPRTLRRAIDNLSK
jgi:protein SCO1/2